MQENRDTLLVSDMMRAPDDERVGPGWVEIDWINENLLPGDAGTAAWWKQQLSSIFNTPPKVKPKKLDHDDDGNPRLVNAEAWEKDGEPELGNLFGGITPENGELEWSQPWAEYLEDDKSFEYRPYPTIFPEYKISTTEFRGQVINMEDIRDEDIPEAASLSDGLKWLKQFMQETPVPMRNRVIQLAVAMTGTMGDATQENGPGDTHLAKLEFDAAVASALRRETIGRCEWRKDMACVYFAQRNWPRVFAPYWPSRQVIDTWPIQVISTTLYKLERCIPYIGEDDPLTNKWDWRRIGQEEWTQREVPYWAWQQWRTKDGVATGVTWGWLPHAHKQYRTRWRAAYRSTQRNLALIWKRRYSHMKDIMSMINAGALMNGEPEAFSNIHIANTYRRRNSYTECKRQVDSLLKRNIDIPILPRRWTDDEQANSDTNGTPG
jgi:hypothetical protein